jgi:hypothetical protein
LLLLVTEVSELQPLNADSPMPVQLFGILKCCRAEQPEKQYAGISGIL